MNFLLRCVDTKAVVGMVVCKECDLYHVVDERADPYAFEYLHVPGAGAKWIDELESPEDIGWFHFVAKANDYMNPSVRYEWQVE